MCTPEGVLSLPVDEGEEADPVHMVDAMKEILITLGANGALSTFINSNSGPGCQVVAFEPMYPQYLDHAAFKGGKIVGFEAQSKNRGRREKSRLKKEATFVPVSGTKAGGTLHLDNRKYQLKKDVKDVQIGTYIVTLPKGTILYNLAGGVLADHKSLEQYETRSQKYFKKSTFRGIQVKQKTDTIKDVEKNSKVLENVAPNHNGKSAPFGSGYDELKEACWKGYKAVAGVRKKCFPDSSWSGGQGQCRPAACYVLSAPVNGHVTPQSCSMGTNKIMTKCSFQCDQGFSQSGSRLASCKEMEEWEYPDGPPQCKSNFPPPFIICPPDQTKPLPHGSSSVYVMFSQPKTNVNWFR